MRYKLRGQTKKTNVAQPNELGAGIGKPKHSIKKTVSILSIALILFGPLAFLYIQARASALSFVCASSAAATSTAACAGEQAGDLLLVTAFVNNSSTAPTLATGFTSINTSVNSAGAGSTRTALNSGWNTAATSSSDSGSWTGATQVIMQVYRGQSASPIGNNATQGGSNSGTLVTYGADTLTVTDGSSWFAAFAVRNTAQALMSTAPSSMTNRQSVPATPFAAGHDTNGPTASNWPSTDVTGFSASAKFTSIVIEIKAAPTITVGSTGTQAANMIIPSTSNYVGGSFSFIRDVGTANVTSITVHENGSVNASSNLSNLILFYKQEAVCSTSIPAGTTQFNSTGGTFNASEDSTVTGTMTVGTSQICVYAQVDVGSGATSGDTLELQIGNTPTDNPSSDVVVSAGSVGPTSNVAISGTTTLVPPGPTTDQVLRGGEWFSGGAKQPFFWAQ